MAPFTGASLAQGEAAAHTTYQADLRNRLPAGSGAVPDRPPMGEPFVKRAWWAGPVTLP